MVDKGLIEEAGRKDSPGRPIMYRTTNQFLKYFGLNALSELPKIPEWVDQGGINDVESEITEADNDVGNN